MSIDVGMKALQQASVAHAAASCIPNVESRARAMLLFYAVECALKARIMRESALRDTSMLNAELRSHDLRALAKHLNLPKARWIAQNYTMVASNRGTRSVGITDVHTVWRYGASLVPRDHTRAVEALTDMMEWCVEE